MFYSKIMLHFEYCIAFQESLVQIWPRNHNVLFIYYMCAVKFFQDPCTTLSIQHNIILQSLYTFRLHECYGSAYRLIIPQKLLHKIMYSR